MPHVGLLGESQAQIRRIWLGYGLLPVFIFFSGGNLRRVIISRGFISTETHQSNTRQCVLFRVTAYSVYQTSVPRHFLLTSVTCNCSTTSRLWAPTRSTAVAAQCHLFVMLARMIRFSVAARPTLAPSGGVFVNTSSSVWLLLLSKHFTSILCAYTLHCASTANDHCIFASRCYA